MKEKIKSIVISVLALALVACLVIIVNLVSGVPASLSLASSASIHNTPASNPLSLPSSSESANSWPDILAESSFPDDNIPHEIERKFLVELADLPPAMATLGKSYSIEQTYISESPEIRVRKIGSQQFYFAIKSARDETGLSRAELDFTISAQVYSKLVKMKVGNTIYKTRYQFYDQGTQVFVDVYGGDLEGLAVVEVEFNSVQEANSFIPPTWFSEDVTSDKRYKNLQLALNGLPEPRVL